MRTASVTVTVVLAGAHAVSGQGHTMPDDYARRLVAAAVEQTRSSVAYDPAYRRIAYPGGDVPANIGVCADVIVRAYRKVGVDLQVKVHEDMRRDFRAYPRIWGLKRPDSNIDHRRVPNLRTYLRRVGAELAVSNQASRYRPGDVVTWTVPPHLPHIGIVSDQVAEGDRHLIVHNIGRGAELEDMLFAFPITGHYRYTAR